MAIETLDDIVEEIADRAGIYGVCPNPSPCKAQGQDCCRPVFVTNLKIRIRNAANVERTLWSQKVLLADHWEQTP